MKYNKGDKPHNFLYSDEYLLEMILLISKQLGFIPTASEMRSIKVSGFNGGSAYGKITSRYESEFVPIIKSKTNLIYRSNYFFIDNIRLKSREEVYFVNFFKLHGINFIYEPKLFKFGEFVKLPDFYVNDCYYDIAGYYSKEYNDKINDSKYEFEQNNVNYSVINVNMSDLFSFDFYIDMCKTFNVSPIFSDDTEGLILYKTMVKWDTSRYDNDIKKLRELLIKINELKYKDDEYFLILKLIKKLGFQNIKNSCIILDVKFKGRRDVKHGEGTLHRTPDCITNGSFKEYLIKNPNKSIREIEREGIFDISRRTMSKYKKVWYC